MLYWFGLWYGVGVDCIYLVVCVFGDYCGSEDFVESICEGDELVWYGEFDLFDGGEVVGIEVD